MQVAATDGKLCFYELSSRICSSTTKIMMTRGPIRVYAGLQMCNRHRRCSHGHRHQSYHHTLSVNGRHKRHRRHRKKYACQRCCTGTHHNLKNVRTLKMQKCCSPPGLYILYCYAFTCQNPFHKLATPSDLTVLEKQSKSPV